MPRIQATPEHKGDTIANDIAYSKVLYRISSTGIGRTISKDMLASRNPGMWNYNKNW